MSKAVLNKSYPIAKTSVIFGFEELPVRAKHNFPFNAIEPGFSFVVTEKDAKRFKSVYDSVRSLASQQTRHGKLFQTTKISATKIVVSRIA